MHAELHAARPLRGADRPRFLKAEKDKRRPICTFKAHADLHADLHAARRQMAQIDRGFYCTSNLHSNAADGLLHIQSAHQKRKCNRPLSVKSANNRQTKLECNTRSYMSLGLDVHESVQSFIIKNVVFFCVIFIVRQTFVIYFVLLRTTLVDRTPNLSLCFCASKIK
jgi:hypothetical protein